MMDCEEVKSGYGVNKREQRNIHKTFQKVKKESYFLIRQEIGGLETPPSCNQRSHLLRATVVIYNVLLYIIKESFITKIFFKIHEMLRSATFDELKLSFPLHKSTLVFGMSITIFSGSQKFKSMKYNV